MAKITWQNFLPLTNSNNGCPRVPAQVKSLWVKSKAGVTRLEKSVAWVHSQMPVLRRQSTSLCKSCKVLVLSPLPSRSLHTRTSAFCISQDRKLDPIKACISEQGMQSRINPFSLNLGSHTSLAKMNTLGNLPTSQFSSFFP